MIVDFHSHILPKIDDGSKSTAMSLEMLAVAKTNHIDVMLATPHFYAHMNVPERFIRQRDAAYAHLLAADGIEALPKILLGAEVAYYPGISRAIETLKALCVQHTNLLLIEMPFSQWTDREISEIAELTQVGFQIIIVHFERFIPFQKRKGPMEMLLALPVLIQINAESFISWSERRKVLKLFQNGEAQLLGSDCHNMTSRPQNLFVARECLAKKFGSDFMNDLDTFAGRLIGPALKSL